MTPPTKRARPNEAYDLVVIGGGSGGLAAARRARLLGARVCLVDREVGRLGGTCVNVGCVPKKLFWIEAERMINTSTFVEHGNSQCATSKTSFNWSEFKRRREEYIGRLNVIYKDNLVKEGIDVIEGKAKLVDDRTISITPNTAGAEELLVDARYIVIATGSHPVLPQGIKNHELGITSDDFFRLPLQPRRCAIVGGGYVAAELAGIFRSFGTEVSVFVRGTSMLGIRFDEMLQRVVTETMQRNMTLHLSTQVCALEREKDSTITIQTDASERITGFDCVIWAIGRTANLLDSSSLKLSTTERGFLKTDSDLCCYTHENERLDTVFGIGDVTGWHMLTPVAISNGRLLAERLFSPKDVGALDRVNEDLIPSVLFTHPPVGTIGLTEAAAVARHGRDGINIYTRSFNHMNCAFAKDSVKSSYKLITLKNDKEGEGEKVIGVHLYGHGTEEALQGIAIAMQAGVTKEQLDRTVAIHPTGIEEIINMK